MQLQDHVWDLDAGLVIPCNSPKRRGNTIWKLLVCDDQCHLFASGADGTARHACDSKETWHDSRQAGLVCNKGAKIWVKIALACEVLTRHVLGTCWQQWQRPQGKGPKAKAQRLGPMARPKRAGARTQGCKGKGASVWPHPPKGQWPNGKGPRTRARQAC